MPWVHLQSLDYRHMPELGSLSLANGDWFNVNHAFGNCSAGSAGSEGGG